MEENIISVNVHLPNYMVERLKTLAINKSEKTGLLFITISLS